MIETASPPLDRLAPPSARRRPARRGTAWTRVAAAVLIAGTVHLAGCLPSDVLTRRLIVPPQYEGKGDFTLFSGDRYKGDFRDGELVRGTVTYANGYRYEGEFHDGKLHGRGTMVEADGTRFEGEFRNGKLVRGTHTRADGFRYEGEFRNGELHGHGTIISPDGTRYEGEFRNGEPLIPDTFPVLPENPQVEWSI